MSVCVYARVCMSVRVSERECLSTDVRSWLMASGPGNDSSTVSFMWISALWTSTTNDSTGNHTVCVCMCDLVVMFCYIWRLECCGVRVLLNVDLCHLNMVSLQLHMNLCSFGLQYV